MAQAKRRFEGIARHGRGLCVGLCRDKEGAALPVGLTVSSVSVTPTQSVARVQCEVCLTSWKRIICLGTA